MLLALQTSGDREETRGSLGDTEGLEPVRLARGKVDFKSPGIRGTQLPTCVGESADTLGYRFQVAIGKRRCPT